MKDVYEDQFRSIRESVDKIADERDLYYELIMLYHDAVERAHAEGGPEVRSILEAAHNQIRSMLQEHTKKTVANEDVR